MLSICNFDWSASDLVPSSLPEP